MSVCDKGGGSKIIKNSVTYFMDGPYEKGPQGVPGKLGK